MKKLLLSTAALVSLFSASQAQAAPAIELDVGGFMTFYGTYASQKKNTLVTTETDLSTLTATSERIGSYNNFDLMGNAEIYFSGSYTFENDVKVGAMVQLEAGTDSGTSNQVIDETYLTVDSKYGRVYVGNLKNVSNMMAVRSVSVSTLGFQETDFTRLIAVPTLFSYNQATYATLDDISTKINYISPTIGGFTVGVSLMPGNKQKGKDADNLLIPNDGIKLFKYGIDAVAAYSVDFGKVKMDVSGTYTTYKPNLIANGLPGHQDDTKEYGGGVMLWMGNLGFGGSYHKIEANHEMSKLASLLNLYINNGYTWETGVTYSFDRVSTSLNYMHTEADNPFDIGAKDSYDQYQLSTKYKLASGIDVFADLAYLQYDGSKALGTGYSNKGFGMAVGMNLTF